MPSWIPSLPWLLAQQPEPGPAGLLSMLMPILIIGVLFYLLMVVPEKRKRAEIGKMQENLKKNDRVVTIGGIQGVVVNTQAGSRWITLRVDESNNTRIEILRSSVANVLSDERAEGGKTES